MLFDVTRVMVQILWLMHQLTQGVSAGGSLALVLKLLSWADSHPVAPIAPAFCEAISGWHFDWSSFAAGLVCGVLLYTAVEFCITLRWAIAQWAANRAGLQPAFDQKPRFKILA